MSNEKEHRPSELRMIPLDRIEVLNPRERNSRVFYNIFHPVLGYLIYGLLIVTISFSSTKLIRYAIGTMVVVTILNIHGCNYVLNSAMKSL